MLVKLGSVIFMLLFSALATLAVEAVAGPPIALSLRISGRETMPGGTLTLTISAEDVDYMIEQDGRITDKINDPVHISWQATGGSLQLLTPANLSPYTVKWTAPATPGYYVLYISADDEGRGYDDVAVNRVIEVTVRQAGGNIVPSVRVTASPQTINLKLGNNSIITAQLVGKDIAGKTVNFFTTSGVLSSVSAVSDANGLAAVRLTAGIRDVGTAVVAASYSNTTSTTTVEIVSGNPQPLPPTPIPPGPPLPPYVPAFLIDVNPPALPADGTSTAQVTVRLTDGRGLGIRNQWVDFTSSFGRIQFRGRTDIYGYARVVLYAPDQPGTSLITATSGALRSYTTVQFYQQRVVQTGSPRVFLTVTPTTVLADGTSRIVVAALVLDRDGYALRTNVEFSSTLGTVITPLARTNGDGQAATYLQAPTTPGMAVVSARVDDIVAASQVVFQAIAANTGVGLNIVQWSSQQEYYAAENWLFRQWHKEGGAQANSGNELIILDTNGVATRRIPLATSVSLLRDQYGLAHGYGQIKNDELSIDVLSPAGDIQRSIKLRLQPGIEIKNLSYADPSGIILVGLANPDGSKAQVYLYSAQGETLVSLSDGLESYPIAFLNGDGHLALALAGGTTRLYNPQGAIVGEGKRTDGLPATWLTIAPNGEWFAVAAEMTGQKETPPRLNIFSRQGTLLFVFNAAVRGLNSAGKNALVVKTDTGTQYLDITERKVKWTMTNNYEMMLEVAGTGIFAGLRDPKTEQFISRVLVVQLKSGKVLASQDFNNLYEIRALLPADAEANIRLLCKEYLLKFPLPLEDK